MDSNKNLDNAQINVEWVCPICKMTKMVNQCDIAEIGVPMCSECECEMGIDS